MKKLSFLALAAAGLLMVGCSSDKDVVQGEMPNVENGEQFISLSINMPTQNSTTRATDDNNYEDGKFDLNDGLPSEYAVNNAYLILFHPSSESNATEDDATFVAVYDVNTEPWEDANDPHVTKNSAKIIKKVGSTVSTGDLALAILNKNNLLTFTPATATEPAKIAVGSTAITTATTYKDFREMIVETTTLGAAPMVGGGFFMANAPLTDTKGSTLSAMTNAKIRTLIPITVYETEALAQAAEPAHIYVERGMAKVTMNALGSITLDGDGTTTLSLEGWTVDQTNKKSYLIRSTESHSTFITLINQVAQKYRYAGQVEITEGVPGDYKYRTYFAKDPNYNNNSGEFTLAAATDYTNAVGDDHPQYCFENTFDVAHQTVQNTTLVRLKVKVGTGDDLFIVSGNKSTIYKESGVKTLAANAAVTAIQSAITSGTATVASTGTTFDESDFDITVAEDATNAGQATVTLALKSTSENKFASGLPTVQAALQPAVNTALSDVAIYKGGISYYTIRIKHFGDQLTPWHTGNAAETPAPAVGNIYPTETATTNWLGRYGVLRNNWYDIKINSIKYLGDPTPKDYSNDPTTDDELDGYLSAQIHILSWAKRTQSWDL
ncbi:MAG: Mfa1 fimbrilin C-terminal domain-containing protein [Prevotella sp.]|nr:Mfa1 fimbrilin C-terminal domain-containing protein [Prevotella sp.]